MPVPQKIPRQRLALNGRAAAPTFKTRVTTFPQETSPVRVRVGSDGVMRVLQKDRAETCDRVRKRWPPQRDSRRLSFSVHLYVPHILQ